MSQDARALRSSQLLKHELKRDDLQAIFDNYDSDSNGTIDFVEGREILTRLTLNSGIAPDTLRTFCAKQFSLSDLDKNDSLSFEEFVDFYNALIDFRKQQMAADVLTRCEREACHEMDRTEAAMQEANAKHSLSKHADAAAMQHQSKMLPDAIWMNVNSNDIKIDMEQLKEYQELFRQYDTDRSGFISADEVQVMFSKRHGIDMTDLTLMRMLELFDLNDKTVLSMTEFVGMVRCIENLQLLDKDVFGETEVSFAAYKDIKLRMRQFKMLFQSYDMDQSGSITRDELMLILCGIDGCNPTQVERIVKLMDMNQDGEIDLSEFMMHIPFFETVMYKLSQ